MERKVKSKEYISSASGSSAASRGTAISLEAYQAIRAAVAEEVAITSHSSATERGAFSRERDPATAHGIIVVRQTFLNLVSIYYICIILF